MDELITFIREKLVEFGIAIAYQDYIPQDTADNVASVSYETGGESTQSNCNELYLTIPLLVTYRGSEDRLASLGLIDNARRNIANITQEDLTNGSVRYIQAQPIQLVGKVENERINYAFSLIYEYGG